MSHFTSVKTRMVVKEHLQRALGDLGYAYEEGNMRIRGYGGLETTAEMRVSTKSCGYDIGFRRGADGYDVIADWWGISGVSEETFVRQLTQRYSYWTVRSKLETQGFALVEEKQRDDASVHLVLRRMA